MTSSKQGQTRRPCQLRHDRDFFADSDTGSILAKIARANPLVIFIGAGVSASRGLPQWSDLLKKLVEKASLEMPELSEHGRTQFVDELLKTKDPTILGSVIRRFYPTYEALNASLRKRLYGEPDAPLALTFVRAVCRLILTRHAADLITPVVTTNYDDVLEHAFVDDPFVRSVEVPAGHPQVIPVYSKKTLAQEKAGDLAIHHIHGYVPNEDKPPPSHEIVLSARDYGTDWTSHWSNTVLSNLWNANWLFVGMSFHDPHISFILSERQRHARTDAPRPLGLFSLQGQPWPDLETLAKQALLEAEVARLEDLGMIAEPTSYYFEDAQFLHEASALVAPGERKWRSYDDRRTDWWQRFSEILDDSQNSEWRKLQDIIHRSVVGIRDEVEDCASEFAAKAGECCKVELWCHDPSTNSLFLLGTSQAAHYDMKRVARYQVSASSRIAAVAAFTRGGPYDDEPALVGEQLSLWQYSLGVPVTLVGEPWKGLNVGTLVFASTQKKAAATISTQRAAIENRLVGWIALAQHALNPNTKRHTGGRPTAKRSG
jgi:hypothetical protein